MRLAVIATGLFAVSLSTGWAAEHNTKSPEEWFAQMAQSLRTVSYEGTFVYVSGPRMETLRLQHEVDQNGEREHLISLTGTPREVVRNGGAVTSILPDARSVFSQSQTHTNAFPMALGEAFQHLDKLYSFRSLGRDRIAERESEQIQVKPRDGYRYGYRVWLDGQTAIPLRVDLLDETGYPLEQVMFTSFRVLEKVSDDESSHTSQAVESSVPAMPEPKSDGALTLKHWRIISLPDGFTLSSHIKETMPGSNQPVDHVVFSDGLVSVSAYMERMSKRKGLKGVSRMGAFSAFGVQHDDYQVTVVGEVPPKTVETIGRAIVLGTAGR